MYLGMAHMYWIHDHVIVSVQLTTALTWCAGAFFVWFCGYYLYALVAELITTPGVARKLLYLQADVAHLFGIGLPMLGMVLWPGTFMAMGGHEPPMTHHPLPNMHQEMPVDADHPPHHHPVE